MNARAWTLQRRKVPLFSCLYYWDIIDCGKRSGAALRTAAPGVGWDWGSGRALKVGVALGARWGRLSSCARACTGRRCGGRGEALRSVAAKRVTGKARDRPLADAGVVFLPVRKTPDAWRRSVSS